MWFLAARNFSWSGTLTRSPASPFGTFCLYNFSFLSSAATSTLVSGSRAGSVYLHELEQGSLKLKCSNVMDQQVLIAKV